MGPSKFCVPLFQVSQNTKAKKYDVNTSVPENNGRHLADDILTYILLKEAVIFSFEYHWNSSKWRWATISLGDVLVSNGRQAVCLN